MEGKSLGAIILLVVGIILALALLPTIAQNTQSMVDKQTSANESLSISAARQDASGALQSGYNLTVAHYPTTWRTSGCPIESVVFRNKTATLTLNTDYTVHADEGKLQLNNSKALNGTWGGTDGNYSDNNTWVDYTWCGEGYSTNSGTRGVTGLIVIACALGLMGFAIYMGLKEAGWLHN